MQNSHSGRDFSLSLMILLVGIVTFAVYKGLSTGGDLISQIPLYFSFLDENYLINDPYVQDMKGFSVRSFPVYIIGFLASYIGLDAALLVQHVASSAIVVLAAWIILRSVFQVSEITSCVTIALLVLVPAPALGNSLGLTDIETIPRGAAKALVLLGLALWLQGRVKLAAAGLLAASLFQPAYGLWFSVTVVGVWALERLNPSKVNRFTALIGLMAGFLLVLFVAEKIFLGDASELVFIAAEFRNPHHFFVFFNNPVNWLRILALVLIGLFFLRRAEKVVQTPAAERVTLVFVAMLTIILLGFVLIELIPSRVGLSIQGGRHLYILYFIAVVSGACVINSWIAKRFPMFSQASEMLWERMNSVAGKLRLPYIVAAITVVAIFSPLMSPDAAKFARAAGYVPGLYESVSNKTKDNEATKDSAPVKLALAIQQLPPDSLLLTPPGFGIIRVISRRAIYVDYKSWSFTKPKLWIERIRNAYGPITMPGGRQWANRTSKEWKATGCVDLIARAAKLGATHVIANDDTAGCPTPVLSSGAYKIYKVN